MATTAPTSAFPAATTVTASAAAAKDKTELQPPAEAAAGDGQREDHRVSEGDDQSGDNAPICPRGSQNGSCRGRAVEDSRENSGGGSWDSGTGDAQRACSGEGDERTSGEDGSHHGGEGGGHVEDDGRALGGATEQALANEDVEAAREPPEGSASGTPDDDDEGDHRSEILDPPAANFYAAKKTVAQGMMDIALITSNANQLRYLLEFGSPNPIYYFNMTLVITSLVLQIAVGTALVFKGRADLLRDEPKGKNDKRLNDAILVGVFLITIINVFMAAFAIGSSGSQTREGEQSTAAAAAAAIAAAT